MAYIVAIPANENVIPTIQILTTLTIGNAVVGAGAGVMFESSEFEIANVLRSGGWTTLTAVNLMTKSLFDAALNKIKRFNSEFILLNSISKHLA